ncbi:MAG: acetyl-CoA C-acyltransferase [Pseudomonadales bacterium]|nr:acetyl-CoA C-acyltransferase [Pseudomonadales bacterium]
MKDESIVIVSGARTPIGNFQGVFSATSAPELGAVAVKEALVRAGLNTHQIEELVFGCVLPAGLAQAPARQVALGAGLDVSTQCTTVNKMCGSGMKAVMLAHDQIKAGSCKTAIAGGMENMTLAPYLIPKARGGLRLGHGELKDHLFYDGLEDAYTGRLMGSFAQEIADKKGLTREQMDDYSVASLQRAQEAINKGYFCDEIAAVRVTSRKGETVVIEDELPRVANLEKIPLLKPAFKKDGTITPANSSAISDGAAALLLTTETNALALGLKPLARIIAHTSHAQAPSEFSLAPVGAIRKVLDKSGWDAQEVDLYEINEAFAMVAMLAMRELGLDHNKVNIQGGACALGHPVGASGARIIVTLLYALRRLHKRKGVASLCIGGGEATAMAIEML